MLRVYALIVNLFDPSPFEVPGHRREARPVMAAPSKLERNRQRIVGTQAYAERQMEDVPGEAHTASMEHDYGIPVRGAAPAVSPMVNSITTGEATWRRFGEYREMPLHGNVNVFEGHFGTMQQAVSPQRVAEIAGDPSIGADPRFPGSERALSADVPFRRGGETMYAPVLHNGNHRVAARVLNGELFAPVTHIPAERLGAAKADSLQRAMKYAEPREERNNLAMSRMALRDPTRKTSSW